jgi:hypothetical protein
MIIKQRSNNKKSIEEQLKALQEKYDKLEQEYGAFRIKHADMCIELEEYRENKRKRQE